MTFASRAQVEYPLGWTCEVTVVRLERYVVESLPRREMLAVGDVRSGSTKRVASAVGEGSIAIATVHQVLAE